MHQPDPLPLSSHSKPVDSFWQASALETELRRTLAACRKYGAPVLARGAGTSLAGQCCNVAVVLDFTKYMNQIVELDPVPTENSIQRFSNPM